MEQNIIGRKKEKEILQQVIDSNESRFVAVYGRRRVGKTFLVREFLEDYIVFQCAGLANSTTKDQLKNFFQTLRRYDSSLVEHPSDWLEAFDSLIRYLCSLMNCRGWILPHRGLFQLWNIFGMDGHRQDMTLC